jgi:hypothetical protein
MKIRSRRLVVPDRWREMRLFWIAPPLLSSVAIRRHHQPRSSWIGRKLAKTSGRNYPDDPRFPIETSRRSLVPDARRWAAADGAERRSPSTCQVAEDLSLEDQLAASAWIRQITS